MRVVAVASQVSRPHLNHPGGGEGSMKIFADNNVRQGVFRILHEFGHEGETAQQNNLECLSNGTLSAEAFRPGFRCLLTQDKTFALDASKVLESLSEFAVCSQPKFDSWRARHSFLCGKTPALLCVGKVLCVRRNERQLTKVKILTDEGDSKFPRLRRSHAIESVSSFTYAERRSAHEDAEVCLLQLVSFCFNRINRMQGEEFQHLREGREHERGGRWNRPHRSMVGASHLS